MDSIYEEPDAFGSSKSLPPPPHKYPPEQQQRRNQQQQHQHQQQQYQNQQQQHQHQQQQYQNQQQQHQHPSQQQQLDSKPLLSCHYEEAFVEASEPQIPEAIRSCYKATFKAVVYYFYVFLSILVGPILIVVYGLLLSLNSFLITWCLSPVFRCCGMCFSVWLSCIVSWLNCCLTPYLRVLGHCCSGIVVRYQKVPEGQVIHV